MSLREARPFTNYTASFARYIPFFTAMFIDLDLRGIDTPLGRWVWRFGWAFASKH